MTAGTPGRFFTAGTPGRFFYYGRILHSRKRFNLHHAELFV
jgi:hypothetical protein